MNSPVCVDASLVLKLGLPEEGSEQVEALWRNWQRQGVEIVAPPLLRYEITSVLCNSVYRGRITPDEGFQILTRLLALPIGFVATEDLHLAAWETAMKLKQSIAYDAHYLALAEALGCELWTADRKLYQMAAAKIPQVHLVY